MNTEVKDEPITREVYINFMAVETLHGEGEVKVVGTAGELAEDLLYKGTVMCPKGAWGFAGDFNGKGGVLFGDSYEKLLSKLRYHFGEVRLNPISAEQRYAILQEQFHL